MAPEIDLLRQHDLQIRMLAGDENGSTQSPRPLFAAVNCANMLELWNCGLMRGWTWPR